MKNTKTSYDASWRHCLNLGDSAVSKKHNFFFLSFHSTWLMRVVFLLNSWNSVRFVIDKLGLLPMVLTFLCLGHNSRYQVFIVYDWMINIVQPVQKDNVYGQITHHIAIVQIERIVLLNELFREFLFNFKIRTRDAHLRAVYS